MKRLVIVFIFISCFIASTARAASPLDVVINEIAWMGTTNSATDEWMELKNNTINSIDLSGWKIQSGDEKLKIDLRGTVLPGGFYLLERTDDTSVLSIKADLIYKGILTNSGMDLRLYDNLSNIVDEVNCSSGWFGGDNATKQTLERTNSVDSGSNATNWQTSQGPGGTPRAQNSPGIIKISDQQQLKPAAPVSNQALLNQKKSDNSNKIEAALTNTSQGMEDKNSNPNPWLLFFTVLTATIILAILVLFIKLKVFKNHVRT